MTRLIIIAVVCFLALAGSAQALTRMRPAEVGGTQTRLAQLVDITYNEGSTYYLCSGAIISPDVILTAAHCAGGQNYSVSARAHEAWTARPPIVAPGYDAGAGYVNDAAVLRLDRNVTISPLPVASVAPVAGAVAISYGWGDTNMTGGGADTKPQQLTMAVQSSDWCAAYWSTQFVASDMCATSTGTIASGDSGGPLVANGQIVGINDKAADSVIAPSIFTRTDLLAGWISAEVKRLELGRGVAARGSMARPSRANGIVRGRG